LQLYLLDRLLGCVQVRRKPSLPVQNNDGVEDEVAADSVWKQLRLSEDSIIVDLFRVSHLTLLFVRPLMMSSHGSMVCYLSDDYHTHAPFLNLSMDLRAIWKLRLWGPVTCCIRWGFLTSRLGEIWGVEPLAITCICLLVNSWLQSLNSVFSGTCSQWSSTAAMWHDHTNEYSTRRSIIGRALHWLCITVLVIVLSTYRLNRHDWETRTPPTLWMGHGPLYLLMHQTAYASFGFTAIYSFIAIYSNLWLHSGTDTASSLGRCNSLFALKVI